MWHDRVAYVSLSETLACEILIMWLPWNESTHENKQVPHQGYEQEKQIHFFLLLLFLAQSHRLHLQNSLNTRQTTKTSWWISALLSELKKPNIDWNFSCVDGGTQQRGTNVHWGLLLCAHLTCKAGTDHRLCIRYGPWYGHTVYGTDIVMQQMSSSLNWF